MIMLTTFEEEKFRPLGTTFRGDDKFGLDNTIGGMTAPVSDSASETI